jgi:hypothetical protein
MLTEREVKILYDTARGTVEDAMNEVTIDRHVSEAEIEAQTLARVLGTRYDPSVRMERRV